MSLSNDLISQFVKVTHDDSDAKSKETTVYGTARKDADGSTYVIIDGATQATPVPITANVKTGDRVVVHIKNHTATITGNLESPSINTADIAGIEGQIDQLTDELSSFEVVLANKVDTELFNAEVARINSLDANYLTVREELNANTANVENLQAANVDIRDTLTANSASIESLQTDKLDTTFAEATYATIGELEATNVNVNNLTATHSDFVKTTTDELTAINGTVKKLDTDKLSATDIEGKFANIDFSNIGKAAIEHFYATSGLIKDVVVDNGTITGKLVGVTISGDLIEGNTVVAEKLVIKGEDGLYYKLNTDGVSTEAEQTDYNSLNGSIIRAKSVTAEKISVSDLVAFDATIGGFNITEKAIYSGAKSSADNSTRGLYMDSDGQLSIGDASNYIKYYKDASGNYKLEISVGQKSVETEITDIKSDIDTLREEITTFLHIESSRGVVFKNNAVSTILSAVVYRGTKRITDINTLKSEMGPGAYLQWYWQRLNEDSYGLISSDDSRIGNGGFTFTLGPDDVDVKVTFICELIT